MNLMLAEMTGKQFQAWLATGLADYVGDRIRSGESPDLARKTAEDSFRNLFPGGEPLPGHVVRIAVDAAGKSFGAVWVGPQADAPANEWWVWDIAVDENARGLGYGRQIMKLAEDEVRMRGGTRLGLHVFGFNKVAQNLYESLGYEPTSIRMSKDLQAND